ncbi:hypothetical protein [Methanolobus psychrotolerans]|uniref:hypothetical protein n=1 Tax=Methanolobus psychrotolerans TaxID=1874706 RepID=UPI000B91A470|nr:hypothetical protein [Methanolobus psychrotolerans]
MVVRVSADTAGTLKALDKLREDLDNGTQERLEKAGVFLETKMTEKIMSRLQPPLKARTVASKGSSTPLIDEGELLDQIDHKGGPGYVEVGVFGSRALIARHHEFGAPKANIPERSFMRSASRENRKQIKKIVNGK